MKARVILVLSILGAVLGLALVALYGGGSVGPLPPSLPAATGPELELETARWSIDGGYARFEGRVRNISHETLKNVMAVVSFQDANGRSVTTAEALIDYSTILTGQGSPFSVLTTSKPEMKTARVAFRDLAGGAIGVEGPAAVESPPSEASPARRVSSERGAPVSRAQQGAQWPFTVADGVVVCISDGARSQRALFRTGGKVYALNGTARATREYLEIDPIWRADPALPGSKIDVGPMIDQALALCR